MIDLLAFGVWIALLILASAPMLLILLNSGQRASLLTRGALVVMLICLFWIGLDAWRYRAIPGFPSVWWFMLASLVVLAWHVAAKVLRLPANAASPPDHPELRARRLHHE